jgi:deoxyribonuclease-4
LRLIDTLAHLVDDARAYQLRSFQLFPICEGAKTYIYPTTEQKNEFVQARRLLFGPLYMHSSYWINPATYHKHTFLHSRSLLKKELALARDLEIEFLVLHAGSAKGYQETPEDPQGKLRGLITLAKMLNGLAKHQENVVFLLENGAHGKKTLGSDLEDFGLLKGYLDFPEKIGFCLDTAHAFSYGYKLAPLEDFISLVDSTMGLSSVKLMHFNDTRDECGEMLDKHAFPGQGTIGKKILKQILYHPAFEKIPKIIEGSAESAPISLALFHEIKDW